MRQSVLLILGVAVVVIVALQPAPIELEAFAIGAPEIEPFEAPIEERAPVVLERVVPPPTPQRRASPVPLRQTEPAPTVEFPEPDAPPAEYFVPPPRAFASISPLPDDDRSSPAPTTIPRRAHDPEIATRLLAAGMREHDKRHGHEPAGAGGIARVVEDIVTTRELKDGIAVLSARLERDGSVREVKLVSVEHGARDAWHEATREAGIRLRGTRFDMRGPFRDGALITLRIEPQRAPGIQLFPGMPREWPPDGSWPFYPKPDPPHTERLTGVDVPMEANIPLPRWRGPLIDVFGFDISQYDPSSRPRITFRIEALDPLARRAEAVTEAAPK